MISCGSTNGTGAYTYFHSVGSGFHQKFSGFTRRNISHNDIDIWLFCFYIFQYTDYALRMSMRDLISMT